MSDSTHDHLVANVEGALEFASLLDRLLEVDTLEELDDDERETLADHGHPDLDDDPIELVDTLLAEEVLEIYGNARVTYDTVDVRELVVVTGTGGPHIEFGIDYTGRVLARGYWGSDKVERVGHVDRLDDYLVELIGGWDR